MNSQLAHDDCRRIRPCECSRLQETQLLRGDRATRKHAKDSWNGRGNDNFGWNDFQMYFKVIKSGTNRKLVYDFLFVVYSNFCRITHRFLEIWCEAVQRPWNMPKVIDSRNTWKLSCGHVCKMFGRQWPNEPKIAIFYDPTLIWRLSPANPREYLHEPYTASNYVPLATFLSWQYMASSANFRTVLSETGDANPLVAEPKTDFNAKWPFKVIQGHLFRCRWRATNWIHSTI